VGLGDFGWDWGGEGIRGTCCKGREKKLKHDLRSSVKRERGERSEAHVRLRLASKGVKCIQYNSATKEKKKKKEWQVRE